MASFLSKPQNLDFEFTNMFSLPNETGTPERRLLLAVLERAILDYVGNDQKEALEAEEWLFDEIDVVRCDEFTFSWICLQLDLDPISICKQIKAMPKRGTHRVAPWYFAKEPQLAKEPQYAHAS